jgi:hypothetical protein
MPNVPTSLTRRINRQHTSTSRLIRIRLTHSMLAHPIGHATDAMVLSVIAKAAVWLSVSKISHLMILTQRVILGLGILYRWVKLICPNQPLQTHFLHLIYMIKQACPRRWQIKIWFQWKSNRRFGTSNGAYPNPICDPYPTLEVTFPQ